MRSEHNTEAETVANRRFADAVTSTAFHLTLSRNMVAALRWLYTGKKTESVGQVQMTSFSSLEARGLVHWITASESNCRLECRLTRVGEAVCDLLVVAGLIPGIPTGKPRKKNRG